MGGWVGGWLGLHDQNPWAGMREREERRKRKRKKASAVAVVVCSFVGWVRWVGVYEEALRPCLLLCVSLCVCVCSFFLPSSFFLLYESCIHFPPLSPLSLSVSLPLNIHPSTSLFYMDTIFSSHKAKPCTHAILLHLLPSSPPPPPPPIYFFARFRPPPFSFFFFFSTSSSSSSSPSSSSRSRFKLALTTSISSSHPA